MFLPNKSKESAENDMKFEFNLLSFQLGFRFCFQWFKNIIKYQLLNEIIINIKINIK